MYLVKLNLRQAFEKIEMRTLIIEPSFLAIHLRYATDMRTLSVELKNRPYLVN